MNSNFQINSYRNFNSDFIHLVPSKFVTFGGSSLSKINSEISDNSSAKEDNNIIFRQFPSDQSKFKFDYDKGLTNYRKNNIILKDDTTNEQPINKDISPKKKAPILFNNNFQIGSKTILNPINTCLLNLFSPTKKNNINNTENKENKSQSNSNNIYMMNSFNKKFTSSNNDNNNKTNSFYEKINFSPVKKMSLNKNENEYSKNEKLIEIDNHNDLRTISNNIPQQKTINQGAFKAMNNIYQNPAKIHQQYPYFSGHINEQNSISNNIPNITQISNITNVTNNYYFQCKPKTLLRKKTKRMQNNDNIIESLSAKKIKENTIASKTPKKDNLSYGLYQLNQIAVNGVSISKFPVVSMNDDDLEIHLLSKMLTDTDYFTIVDKYYINIPVLDEEKYHKPSYDQVFKKEKEKISNLYLIGDNLNENNPVNLIRNFYSQIKNKILTIQKNYLSNNKKALSVNVELLIELEKLIKSCNAITNTVTDYKKSGLKRKLFLEQSDDEDKNKKDKNNFIKEDKKNNKEINSENNKNPYTENKNITENNTNEDNINQNSKKRKQKKKHFKTYLCEFCNKAYSNGQGLGGHMSRIHPNQSYKYKDKIRIRREREKKREKLLNIKQGLFKKYGYDYDKLINDKNKTFIQQFLSEHNEEYRNIRKIQQKQDKNKENISENSDDKKSTNFNVFVTPMPGKVVNTEQRRVELGENRRSNFSKQKTNDKTQLKINEKENTETGKDKGRNEIGFNTKLKINFELNKE